MFVVELIKAAWSWILANPVEAGGIAGAVLGILLGAYGVFRAEGLRRGLLALMLQADRARRHGKLGRIDGPQVMELVIQWAMATLVPGLPLWLRPLFTADRLRKWTQGLYDMSLDYLDDGLLNGTHPTLPDDQVAAAEQKVPGHYV